MMNQLRLMDELVKSMLSARNSGMTGGEEEEKKIYSQVRRLMGIEMQQMVNELLSWKGDIESMRSIIDVLNSEGIVSNSGSGTNGDEARGDMITQRLLVVMRRALEEVFKVMKDYPQNVMKVKVRRGEDGEIEMMQDDEDEE